MLTFLAYQLAKEKVKKNVLLCSEACQKGNQHKMGQIGI
jgi:hydroxylamine reductase (hybrid-cluster protein)